MSNMKKTVLGLVIEDEKSKKKTKKAIEGVEGVMSVTVDMENTITVYGEVDPVFLIRKLKKVGFKNTELLSLDPAEMSDPPAFIYAYQEGNDPNGCTIC